MRLVNPILTLRPGQVVNNTTSLRRYRVRNQIGIGGFGAVYRVKQIAGGRRFAGELCLKVAAGPDAWHREAYFGDLLSGVPGVVRVYESFAWAPPRTRNQTLYCLITEFASGGDLAGYFAAHPEPWSERKARREIARLLETAELLHEEKAVHRDITPYNVFVTADRTLKLGDFGAATHRLGKGQFSADVFNPGWAPTAVKTYRDRSWRPADDVYQFGQLFATLLSGDARSKFRSREVKALPCSPSAKSIIQRCIGKRMKRFANAGQMLKELRRRDLQAPRRLGVRCLKGKRIVLTGRLSILREEAIRSATRAGGIIQRKVGHNTDIVVFGDGSPLWKADRKGQKLLDVDSERDRGHDIALLTERRFLALVLDQKQRKHKRGSTSALVEMSSRAGFAG